MPICALFGATFGMRQLVLLMMRAWALLGMQNEMHLTAVKRVRCIVLLRAAYNAPSIMPQIMLLDVSLNVLPHLIDPPEGETDTAHVLIFDRRKVLDLSKQGKKRSV
ncbi:hypothetical protein AA105894_1647 [Asaia spathodeae NBRC 105894]|nr:hypothetical protein AA105894_1647 [Asaia spathodeae NBRC 105894]